MKIHIIGGPVSGKSSIARALAAEFGLPVLELDNIHWDHDAHGYGTPAPPEKRDAALADFLKQPAWVVEGVYHRWVGPSFAQADHILVLNPPLWLRQIRIARRSLRRKLGLEPGKKESFQNIRDLLKWSQGFDADNLARALAMLEENQWAYVRCTGLGEAMK